MRTARRGEGSVERAADAARGGGAAAATSNAPLCCDPHQTERDRTESRWAAASTERDAERSGADGTKRTERHRPDGTAPLGGGVEDGILRGGGAGGVGGAEANRPPLRRRPPAQRPHDAWELLGTAGVYTIFFRAGAQGRKRAKAPPLFIIFISATTAQGGGACAFIARATTAAGGGRESPEKATPATGITAGPLCLCIGALRVRA